MSQTTSPERPLGIYLVALYFVLAGFFEAIEMYRGWDTPLSFSFTAEHSIWELVTHTVLHLVLALLVWNFTALGRLGALVYGYVVLAMYVGIAVMYFLYDGAHLTPLKVSLAIFHVTALIPVVAYLQPKRQKRLFHVSLIELIFSNE